jgi:flagellar secretion chaperone FliS
MMNARAANTYRRVDLDSAPKQQIVDRLFDRFAQDVANARAAILAGDIVKRASMIDHALRIVSELAASLDHGVAPELCANLAALYDFVSDRLSIANLKREVKPLDEATKIMAEIGGAFRGAK